MMVWPLEDVAASVADIKVPHPCIWYFVYFENLFQSFPYFFNLLLISIIFLWYNHNLGQISLKYFCTTLYEKASSLRCSPMYEFKSGRLFIRSGALDAPSYGLRRNYALSLLWNFTKVCRHLGCFLCQNNKIYCYDIFETFITTDW